MNDPKYRALYELFQTMGETAIDIHWGDCPYVTQKDADKLSVEEMDEVFNSSCLELAVASIDAEWFTRLPAVLAEIYNKRLEIACVKKEMKI